MPSDPAAGARIRSFIAIDVQGPARGEIERLLSRLRATNADVAWSRPDALHVTLKFLGSVEPERLTELGSRLAEAAREQPRFTVTLAGLGAFPSATRPRVLWVGVDAPELTAFADVVERLCLAAGFPAEERAFHPHLTLGRIRPPRRTSARGGAGAQSDHGGTRAIAGILRAERDTRFGASPVEEVLLYRSDLGSAGARHSVLARGAFAIA